MFEHRLKHRGLADTLSYYKKVRLSFTRWLCGSPVLKLDDTISLDSNGLCQENRLLVDYLNTCTERGTRTEALRAIMTLLSLGRAFYSKAVLDTSTITDPWEGQEINLSDHQHNTILRWLKVKPADPAWQSFHFTTKKGPNGPALSNSPKDLTSLPQSAISDLLLIAGGGLWAWVSRSKQPTPIGRLSFLEIWKKLYKKDEQHPRKLSYFSDKEGKTRVIAILDYWSQTALKPLHDHLMGVLRGIKQDCTFNQDAFHTKLPSSGPYYCFDLHAATDRMPLYIQKKILKSIVGEEKSEAWARLLTDIGFVNHKHPGVIWKYNTGQPMGAYSSWAMMALTHHYLVQASALKSGYKRYFKKYVLLGDDIVIACPKVAVQYKILLSQLSMPISESKTHVSNDTFEFAKRWFHRGDEISGYSIGGLLETWKRYSLLHEFLENQQRHGWSLSIQGRPGFISTLYSCFNRPSCERVIKLYKVYYYIQKILKTVSTDIDPKFEYYSSMLLNTICSEFGIKRPLTWDLFSSPSKEVVTLLVEQVKRRIVAEDMRKLTVHKKKILENILHPFTVEFPNLDSKLYRALLGLCYPGTECLNAIVRKQYDMVWRINSKDPTINIFELGISKYFLTENILTIRAAQSISLAESQMTKWFLFLLREKGFLESDLLSYINERCNTTYTPNYVNRKEEVDYYLPFNMKKREAFFRKRSALRKAKSKSSKLSNTVIKK